jgi:hypothetical protein
MIAFPAKRASHLNYLVLVVVGLQVSSDLNDGLSVRHGFSPFVTVD